MKKNLAKKVTLSILAGAVLMSSSVVWAANDPEVNGWVKNSSDYYYLWNGVSGGAPNGEVNGSGHEFDYEFYGAFNTSESVSGGKVTISDGTFNGYVYGGYSEPGNATENTVTISNGTFDGENGDAEVYGGCSDSGEASKNTVNIGGGKFDSVGVYGGYSDSGEASHNKIVISKVDVGSTFGDIFGGLADGNANDNKVTLNAKDATYQDGDGIVGGYSDSGVATKNTLTVTAGTFVGVGVYGGYSDGDATYNTVTISGGKFDDAEVCGGYSYDGNATENTVNISGAADLSTADLYGGYVTGSGYVSDNILNIGWDGTQEAAWSGTGTGKVKSIQGFDVINFAYVNWDTMKPVVEVESLALNNTEIKVGTVNVAGGTILANGDKMTLISASDISGEISNNGEKVVINKGIAEQLNGSVEQNNTNKKIYLKLGDGPDEGYTVPGGSTRNDQVLVLGESRAAAVAFTNQGSELIETGLNALARDNEKDTKVFAAVYGNHSEYETGSHVNVNGWSGIVGIGKTSANGLTVGAFFENGEGNYSTHNIFTNDYIRGDGEACYNGGGFLVRKDNANGVYAEASLRAGNLQNELRNAVRNGSELTGYDIDTFYYGAHVGIGKVIARGNDGDSIDVYGKFIYTHHDGETFDIGGTATKFDSVESERLRLGFRINEVQTNKLSMYYGAAWEYEFNGDAHDKIASFDLETPSLEGSTVIGEIGAHYKASDKWSIDLNGRAYVGQREGFSGSVQANYAF